MTGLGMMLKAFGVNVTEEHIKTIEELIPVMPGKIEQAFKTVDQMVTSTSERLAAMENELVQHNILLREQLRITAEVLKDYAAVLEGFKASIEMLQATAGGKVKQSGPGKQRTN